MRDAAKRRYQNPEERAKTSETAIKRWQNPEERQRQSERSRTSLNTPETKEKHRLACIERSKTHFETYSKAMKRRWQNPEEIARGRAAMKKLNENEEFAARLREINRLPKSAEHRSNIAKSRIGIKLSIKHKENIGNSSRLSWATATPERREKQSEVALSNARKAGRNKPSCLEVAVKKVLDKHKIEYIHQARIQNYLIDFLIGRVVVEVDGARWHNTPERIEKDKIRDATLVALGYRVIRLLESGIKKDVEEYMNDKLGFLTGLGPDCGNRR